jgi:hypothetical protein
MLRKYPKIYDNRKNSIKIIFENFKSIRIEIKDIMLVKREKKAD